MKTLEIGRCVRLRVCLFMLLAVCTYFIVRFYLSMEFRCFERMWKLRKLYQNNSSLEIHCVRNYYEQAFIVWFISSVRTLPCVSIELIYMSVFVCAFKLSSVGFDACYNVWVASDGQTVCAHGSKNMSMSVCFCVCVFVWPKTFIQLTFTTGFRSKWSVHLRLPK